MERHQFVALDPPADDRFHKVMKSHSTQESLKLRTPIASAQALMCCFALLTAGLLSDAVGV